MGGYWPLVLSLSLPHTRAQRYPQTLSSLNIRAQILNKKGNKIPNHEVKTEFFSIDARTHTLGCKHPQRQGVKSKGYNRRMVRQTKDEAPRHPATPTWEYVKKAEQ